MRNVCRTGACILTAAVLISTAGCPQVESRTNNQGGSNVVSLGLKLASDDIGGMNPDDWQVLTDNLPEFASVLGVDTAGISLPSMSDDEAAALDTLLESSGVTGIEDLQQLGDDIAAGTVEIPADLQDWANELAALFG